MRKQLSIITILLVAMLAMGANWFNPGPQGSSGGSSSGGSVGVIYAPSYIRLTNDAQPVRGSTNTNIQRFTVQDQIYGSDLEHVDSAENGTAVQVKKTGLYEAIANAPVNGTVAIKHGSSINNDYNDTDTDYALGYGNGSEGAQIPALMYLQANDYIWAPTSGTLTNHPDRSVFIVRGPMNISGSSLYTPNSSDGSYLPLAGGTLAGALTLAADPTEDLHAATKQYVDTNISAPAFVQLKASTVARGSTNTSIMRYETLIRSGGTGLTVSHSSALGTTVQVASAGWYDVFGSSPGGASMGINVASSVTNTFATSDTNLPLTYNNDPTQMEQSGLVYCEAGDYIWVDSNGTLSSQPEMARFTVIGPVYSIAD